MGGVALDRTLIIESKFRENGGFEAGDQTVSF
jgi:hypothetical protein